jgi:salicylate hydroxylase
MFHRVDMHKMLMDDALSTEGEGIPVKLVVDHKCSAINLESGLIAFTSGATAQHEVIIGADGVGVYSHKLSRDTLLMVTVCCSITHRHQS